MNNLLSETSNVISGHGELSRLLDDAPTLELDTFISIVDQSLVEHGAAWDAPNRVISRSRAIGRCLTAATSIRYEELSADVHDDDIVLSPIRTLFKPVILDRTDMLAGNVDKFLKLALEQTPECVGHRNQSMQYYLFKIATFESGVHIVPELRRVEAGPIVQYDLWFSGHEASA